MKLTLKGRLIVALLLLFTLAGGGIYYYSRTTGLTVGQIWQQLRSSSQPAGERPSGNSSDVEIKAQLLEGLLQQAELKRQNVEVSVSQGVVTFSGQVEAPQYKTALEQLGHNIAGVQHVINNVTVQALQPQSSSSKATEPDADELLAEKVEFALYKTDAFDLKQITIAAQHGQVRLSGTARNVAEKLLTEYIARDVDGVKKVINELTIQPPG